MKVYPTPSSPLLSHHLPSPSNPLSALPSLPLPHQKHNTTQTKPQENPTRQNPRPVLSCPFCHLTNEPPPSPSPTPYHSITLTLSYSILFCSVLLSFIRCHHIQNKQRAHPPSCLSHPQPKFHPLSSLSSSSLLNQRVTSIQGTHLQASQISRYLMPCVLPSLVLI